MGFAKRQCEYRGALRERAGPAGAAPLGSLFRCCLRGGAHRAAGLWGASGTAVAPGALALGTRVRDPPPSRAARVLRRAGSAAPLRRKL